MSSESTPTAPQPQKVRKNRGFLGKIRLLCLWVILLGLILLQAQVFPHLVWLGLHFGAWRRDISLQMGDVEARLFEPVVLKDVVCIQTSKTGASSRVEVSRVRLWPMWHNALPKPLSTWIGKIKSDPAIPRSGSDALLQQIELDGVAATLHFYDEHTKDIPATLSDWLRGKFAATDFKPGKITVRDATLHILHHDKQLKLEGARLTLDDLEPGSFRCQNASIQTPWFSKSFRSLGARTTLENSPSVRATFSGMTLSPELRFDTLGVDLDGLADGKINISADVTAFGGKVSAQGESVAKGREMNLEIGGSFSKIQIASLSNFFTLSDATGGVIKEGNFTFRGNPRHSNDGELYVRILADNFQWETRQWDSLVLGLSLRDGRLNVPTLELRQGDNQLNLSGTLAIPRAGIPWWRQQFDLKVDAELRNLTNLSALLLPEFKYAAGQLFARGAVNCTGSADGKKPEYGGQLILSGSNLTWRTAPLDVLQAALIFRGEELQIISAQFLHGTDFLRATGVLNLLNLPDYRGEIRATVADLTVYQALLAPPIMPVPLAGGGSFEWSGKNSTAGHEGKFNIQLKEFHTLDGRATLPLDADLVGTYGKERMDFSKFALSGKTTSLTANVGITPKALHLQQIKLNHGSYTALEGEALLALDLWQQWPNVTFNDLISEETVNKIQLKANNLDIHEMAKLTGAAWPVQGVVNGSAQADGTLKAFVLGGGFTISKGLIPFGTKEPAREVEAELTLDKTALKITKCAGLHEADAFTLDGTVDLTNLRAPGLALKGEIRTGETITPVEYSGTLAQPEMKLVVRPDPVPPPTPEATTPPAVEAVPSAKAAPTN